MKSMTGFGAASAPFNSGSLRIEISGVNRKQAEIVVNLPRAWAECESKLRELVTPRISRGRVQVNISQERGEQAAGQLCINEARLQELQAQLPRLQEELGRDISISLGSLERLGVLNESQEEKMEMEELSSLLLATANEALEQFLTMRAEEGEKLKLDLLQRIKTIAGYQAQIMERAPSIPQRYRENLLKRLEQCELPIATDDERIIKEIALFCDRCDISEEMTRLSSHLEQFCKMCEKPESLGRSLDFLCQEISRELNTTGSKANDAQLAQIVVSAKTELEKIREQVQNVE